MENDVVELITLNVVEYVIVHVPTSQLYYCCLVLVPVVVSVNIVPVVVVVALVAVPVVLILVIIVMR